MRDYPQEIDTINFKSETPLRDYTFDLLEVDDTGLVKNAPKLFDGGDHFVSIQRHGDLECILKEPLSAESLYRMAIKGAVLQDGYKIRRPRAGRDDLIIVNRVNTGSRSTCIYGANYLVKGKLGSTPTSEKELGAFITDFQKFSTLRPSVSNVARNLMRQYVHSWNKVNHERVPEEVLRVFYKYGVGGVQDASVIGTRVGVKVDQTAAYLSAMSLLTSPRENVTRNKVWLNDGKYDEMDDFGIYCVDVYVSEALPETPVYREINNVLVPVSGHCKEVVLLKPTMDNVQNLSKKGLGRIEKIHWSWRFKSLSAEKPFTVLYNKLIQQRDLAVESKLFWKLVACAVWGMTLQTRIDYTAKGMPILKGGYWFNPVIGFTTTDLIRSINFRMKMRSMNIGAEVVDMLVGPDGDWYAGETVKKKGPYLYTSINSKFHVASEDDRNNLLGFLEESRKPFFDVPIRGRRTFRDFIFYSASHAKQHFGEIRESNFRVTHDTKRNETKDFKNISMRELKKIQMRLQPYTDQEARETQFNCDSDSDFELMVANDFLAALLEAGKTW